MHNHFIARLRVRCRACGFTLVELMVTIAIAAILAMIAVPSFKRLILSNRLTTAANALTNSINTARMDAIKLNATTQFCGNTSTTNTTDTLGLACGTQTGAVYALPQSATTASQVQTTVPGLTSPVQISSVAAIRFSGQGFGYAPGGTPDTPYTSPPALAVICVSKSQLPSGNQRIITMTAGSIIATASSTGSCP